MRRVSALGLVQSLALKLPLALIDPKPAQGKCLSLFPSSYAPTADGCLSFYLPLTPTTYFPDARTTWSSCSPSPRDWLSSGSTESNVSSPGFPGGNKRKSTSCSQRQLYPTFPDSLHYFVPSETSKPLSLHLFPLPIPVTGRPSGLFKVTRGPETYNT